MLKVMRHHAKYFYVLFVLVILSFIFWGVGRVDNTTTLPVASIGDERISIDEYWRSFYNMADVYRNIYGDKFDDKMQDALKQTVLNSLVEERVLLVAAREAGITVSDAELREAIVNEPSFQRNGAFSSDVYQNTLRLNRLAPEYYEAVKRRELMIEKMKSLVHGAVDLSPAELAALPADEKTGGAVRKALLEKKREEALRSYVEGLKRQMRVTVSPELIS